MSYMKKRNYFRLLFIVMLIILCFFIIFVSTLGVARIPLKESMKIILNNIPFIKNKISLEGISSSHVVIINKIRFPRIILSALIGMALAGSGVIFQGIFKNPMAEPYVLGISSGAAFGATLAIVLGIQSTILGMGAISIMAFLGAVTTTFIVYNVARIGNKTPVVTLLLAGIALSFLLSSLISLFMTFNREQVEKIVFWTMGSVSSASWKHVIISSPIILLGSIVFIIFSRDLNVMLLGEDSAKNLGVEVEKLKKILLIIASIVTASAVAVSGIIGFVGLVIPHIVRLIVGPDHRVLIPFTLISGALFMIITDTLARVLIPPVEIPVGVITSLFGAPFFIYLLCKNKKKNYMG
ncbi:FecCD family ABC transporter permease [Maledivibacter halophilus]|uniref:Iron complex transport system permease protein n=1 Tax=Maledivibacter halophilus TaxID=36842 RepID=A0A1T5IGR2_9FIRM|nr:iron chelate uptake ABC transporter family permease subunit [Maledivibacter halophilus]SKC38270.1 iron complex transport system permease protein [Maledivibacter halophilus]